MIKLKDTYREEHRSPILLICILYLLAVLVQRGASELTAIYSANSVTQNFFENMAGLIFVILIAFRLKLWDQISWFNRQAITSWYLFLLPLAYVLINIGDFYPHTTQDLWLGLFSNLFTGSLEEILCRGLVIALLVNYLHQQQQSYVLLKAALLSSLLFGLVHFVNIFEKPETIGVISGQVIYATFIGMGFAACYLRTRSLFPLMLIHAAINTMGFLTSAPNEVAAASFIDTLPAIIVCSPLMVYGLVILSHKRSQSPDFTKE